MKNTENITIETEADARLKRALKLQRNKQAEKRNATMLDAAIHLRDCARGVFRSRMLQS